MSRKDRPFKNLTPSERWAFQTHERYSLARTAIKWFFAALIVFLAIPLPVWWGAGQDTVITLTYKAILEGKPADKIQKVLIGGLILLCLWQRWLSMRRFKHLGKRSQELERKIDPGRTSSSPNPDP